MKATVIRVKFKTAVEKGLTWPLRYDIIASLCMLEIIIKIGGINRSNKKLGGVLDLA